MKRSTEDIIKAVAVFITSLLWLFVCTAVLMFTPIMEFAGIHFVTGVIVYIILAAMWLGFVPVIAYTWEYIDHFFVKKAIRKK